MISDQPGQSPDAAQAAAVDSTSPADQLSADDIRTIDNGNKRLQASLDADPSASTEVEELIGAATSRLATPTSLQELVQGLNLYLEADTVDHLLKILSNEPDSDYTRQARRTLAPETWKWIRRLLARYGKSLEEVVRLNGLSDAGWKSLNRRLTFNDATKAWGLLLEISKVNGERITLEDSPESMLLLISYMLDSLVSIPTNLDQGVFSDETRTRFAEVSSRLIAAMATKPDQTA